jgi:hypothetical protein
LGGQGPTLGCGAIDDDDDDHDDETLSHILREDHRLRAYGNEMQRRMFGPKREETERNVRFLNEELLYRLLSPVLDLRLLLFFGSLIYFDIW